MKEKLKVVWKILKPVFETIKIGLDLCFLIVLFYGILCIPLLAGYTSYVVDDSNNEINYKKGTLLYYKKVSEGEIKQDDVIVYKTANEMIFHKVMRVIEPKEDEEDALNKKSEYSYEVNVDSYNKETPNHISYANILGKVAPVYLPYVGYFIIFINNNMPLFYILLGVTVIDLLLSFLPFNN